MIDMSNRTLSKFGTCNAASEDRYSFVLIYTFFIHVTMQAFFIFMIIKYGDRTTASEIQFVKDNWFFFYLGLFYTGYTFAQQLITGRCTKFISTIKVQVSVSSYSSRTRSVAQKPVVVTAYKGGLWIGLRMGICLVLNFIIQLVFGAIKTATYVIDTSDLYLHAIFGGMTEELFFRAFVQQSVYDVMYEYVVKRKNKILPGIISIITGAVSFGLAHVNRYGLDPIAIGSPTVAGFNYGIFYFLSEGNVIETMFVHAINNWVAIDQQVKGAQLIGPSETVSIFIAFMLTACVLVCVYMSTKMDELKKTRIQKVFLLICVGAIVFCINGAMLNHYLFYMISTFLIICDVILYTYLKRTTITKKDTLAVLFNCIAITVVIVILMLDVGMEIVIY